MQLLLLTSDVQDEISKTPLPASTDRQDPVWTFKPMAQIHPPQPARGRVHPCFSASAGQSTHHLRTTIAASAVTSSSRQIGLSSVHIAKPEGSSSWLSVLRVCRVLRKVVFSYRILGLRRHTLLPPSITRINLTPPSTPS
ncbi:hypothetical protein VTL71DRAFT_10815 [Oculimacula yallundae]|uniref:Uncharacterized protein n=1 Tax=Oculimacula yallundae TaxID=86028 RepID=A0ABR4CWN8_9HELO